MQRVCHGNGSGRNNFPDFQPTPLVFGATDFLRSKVKKAPYPLPWSINFLLDI